MTTTTDSNVIAKSKDVDKCPSRSPDNFDLVDFSIDSDDDDKSPTDTKEADTMQQMNRNGIDEQLQQPVASNSNCANNNITSSLFDPYLTSSFSNKSECHNNTTGNISPSSTSVSASSNILKKESVSANDDPLSEFMTSSPKNNHPKKPVNPYLNTNANNTGNNGNSSSMASFVSKTHSFTSTFSSLATKAANSFQDAVQNATRVNPSYTSIPPSNSNTMYQNNNPTQTHSNNNVGFNTGHYPSSAVPTSSNTVYGSSSPTTSNSMDSTNKANINSHQDSDNIKKSLLITSAIGNLLPGERVIMFLSHLVNVRDSSTPQTGVGSMWLENTIPNTTNNSNNNDTFHGKTQNQNVIWCCAMTFYRLVLFSYLECDFVDLLDSNKMNEGNSVQNDISTTTTDTKQMNDSTTQPNTSSSSSTSISTSSTCTTPQSPSSDIVINNEQLRKFTQSASISRQYQQLQSKYYYSNNNKNKKYHHVMEIPLASIERIDRVSGDFGSSNMTSSLSLNNNISMTSQLNAAAVNFMGGAISNSTNNGYNNSSANGSNNSNPNSVGLIIYGKDNNRFIQFSTLSYSDCVRAHEALNTYAFPGKRNLGYLFAFESRRSEVMNNLPSPSTNGNLDGNGGANAVNNKNITPNRITSRATPRRFDALLEYHRMGILQPRVYSPKPSFDNDDGGNSDYSKQQITSPWNLYLKINSTYALCTSYPSILIGPSSINDESPEGIRLLRDIASYRSGGRMQTLSWASRHDGASLWRSAQPRVGLQGNRNAADELFMARIVDSAALANSRAVSYGRSLQRPSVDFLKMLVGGMNESDLILDSIAQIGHSDNCMLKIFDLRPKSSAVANRTAGYGYENTSYYKNTTLTFYGISNIHAVRDSYQKLSSLCMNPSTNDLTWNQLVDDTKWLYHIRTILSASWQAAFHIRFNRLPILVHCSHGWDRTSQVCALAQLFLDPYYRTRQGFSCLIEKDFMALGHPFHTRCGHGEGRGGSSSVGSATSSGSSSDEGQIAPIFIQFLDCVYQIVNQYPDYFEFNSKYLLVLSEHVYSCRFGTLLCDTEREREMVACIRQRTNCLWEYLDSYPDLVNSNYNNAYKKMDEEDWEEDGCLMMPIASLLRNVTVWTDRFCLYGPKPTVPCLPLEEMEFILTNEEEHAHAGQCRLGPYIMSTNDLTDLRLRRALTEAEKWKRIAEEKDEEVKKLREQLAENIRN